MNMTAQVSRPTHFGAATIIGILVPLVVAARLARIDFRVPLIPGIALLAIAATVDLAGANAAAREIATVAAAVVIVAVLLALSMQAESRVVLRTWSAATRHRVEQLTPILMVLAALLALAAVVVASVAAFVLLDASLLAALVASAVALVAHLLGKGPTAALCVLGFLALGVATFAIPFGADGVRVDFGTMGFVYLFLAGSFALVHALRSPQEVEQ
jgi:hypothetical protein